MSRPCTNLLKLPFLAALPLLAACSTAAPPALQQTRTNYQAAQQDPQLSKQAAVPLYEANQLLQRAERVWNEEGDRDEVRHLGYLVDRKIELAREQAQQKAAEAQARELSNQAQKLAAERAREADNAQRLAQQRALEAQEAQQQQQLRAREAEQARIQAEQARRESLDQERAAKEAQQRAEAQAQAAQKARESEQEALVRNKKLQHELSELKARQTQRGYEVTLEGVLFELDKAALKPGATRRLMPLVNFLRENRDQTITIEGHTDSLGSDAYNRDLSERRAEAVRDFLAQNGIDPERITARGLGEAYPVASNATEAGRQQNRRVNIIIQSNEQERTAQQSIK